MLNPYEDGVGQKRPCNVLIFLTKADFSVLTSGMM